MDVKAYFQFIRIMTAEYARNASRMTEKDFLKKYPNPVLIGKSLPKKISGLEHEVTESTINIVPYSTLPHPVQKEAQKGQGIEDRLTIYNVQKREGVNVWGMWVCIGVASNNDVILYDKSKKISRFHASFHQKEDEWYITDRSTNGTCVNGEKLEKDKDTPITNGAKIEFVNHKFIFLYPDKARKYMRSMENGSDAPH